jgi:3,4-dihydroxy 2-butanone 4-phosphate synthase/GTP cyclohydrolase II
MMAVDHCADLDRACIVLYSSGVACVVMEGDRMDALKLLPMCVNNED